MKKDIIFIYWLLFNISGNYYDSGRKNGKIVIIVNKKSLSGKEIDTTKLKIYILGKQNLKALLNSFPCIQKIKNYFAIS